LTDIKNLDKSAIKPGFGTEFRGLAPDDLTDPAVLGQVKEALAKTHLVIIREVGISTEDQITLARHIGEPVPFNISRYRHPDYPELMISSNVVRDGKPVGVARVGNFWHQDSSYLPDPPEYTLLQGVLVPEGHGDTLFASAVDVLAAQPEDLRERAVTAHAEHLHSRRFRFRPEHVGLSLPEFRAAVDADYPAAVHPLAPIDVATGERFAYGSAGYTERVLEFDANDNERWFSSIEAFFGDPDRIYRHRWTTGDIVVWKTSITFHSATRLPDTAERIMHRVSIREGS
jgi:taurine dioxygenase